MAAYVPSPAPTAQESVLLYVTEELQRIADALSATDQIVLSVQHGEPDRPRDGAIVYADGTDWEPVSGEGEGFYGYYNSVWNKLG